MQRLIVCLDGTWNDDRQGLRLTNVAKIHRAIAAVDSQGVRQISHYCSGIASIEGERRAFLKGAVGYGVSERIKHAYELITDAYAAGDEIYLFGFSRGAFEARSLAAFIALFGIAKPGLGYSFDDAWAQYRLKESTRNAQRLAELRAASFYPARIRCVGVWDTVGNIGNPFHSGTLFSRSLAFHDTRLNEAIEVGLHALSIDEQRGPFRPALWTLPEGQQLPPHQTIEQVWLAGTHADVGGGFRETALSDVALLWMVKRVKATTGLAFDMDVLEASTYPDPLGAQHSSNAGWIFRLSGFFPFVRLVKQTQDAISPLRRKFIGTWRTGLLPRTVKPINESIDESVVQRFGQKVIELRDGRSHLITYRPRNLVSLVPEPAAPAPKATSGKPSRVMVVTVHGTFAYETDWDNWGTADAQKTSGDRAFINQLSDRLRERGLILEEEDHVQFNWSGGNSHDERRTAAIGLKKYVEAKLREVHAKKGKDYYDRVYLIGHSHGGTISRLAMNLWDKDFDYYDPETGDLVDEFKHDDTCSTCKRERNGRIGPSKAPRPDGVFTFGSPFVTFEKRRSGLFAARLAAWSFRVLVAIPLALLVTFAYYLGPFRAASVVWNLTPGILKTFAILAWPVAVYWLVATLSAQLVAATESRFGKSTFLFTLSAVFQGLKYVLIVAAAAYYYMYATGRTELLLAWPALNNDTFKTWIGWLAVSALAATLLVLVPGTFLSWLRRSVVQLRDKLPKKYDPAEDRPIPYVSYHTPGDEAGLGLRAFGVLTWAVQTLALATAAVLVFGFLLMLASSVEALRAFGGASSLIGGTGASALSDFPEERDKFIALMNSFTFLPDLVWSDFFGATWLPTLADLENRREVVWYVPLALVLATLLVFLFLMPLVAIGISIAYFASIWLRGSGLVFGSEKLSWTIANNINVRRLPNANSALRLMFITPAAWWRREVAHCYYYRSTRVIEDVAAQIADWQNHTPTRAWPIGSTMATAGRLFVVALFAFSIIAVSIPIAAFFAAALNNMGGFINIPNWGMSGPGSMPDPQEAIQFVERGRKYTALKHYDRALADLNKAVELQPDLTIAYHERGRVHKEKGNFASAFADYDKAIELDPKVALSYFGRGNVHRAKGDLDAAVTDYTTGIDLDPSDPKSFGGRGALYIEKGDIDLALADYSKAAELAPRPWQILMLAAVKYGNGDFSGAVADLSRVTEKSDSQAMYRALIRYLASVRSGGTAVPDLEAEVAAIPSKSWPYPVAELYLGKQLPEALLAAATTPGEQCEAQYYVGQWYNLRNASAEAKTALEVATKVCPTDFVEYLAAKAELVRLGR